MSNIITEKARDNLFHSLAAVEAAAPAIKAAMSASLAEDGQAPSIGVGGVAGTLVDMLLDQARILAEGREPGGVEALAAAHRALGIEGRHYSRFGDALTAVLKDAVGPRLPSAVTAAWGDAFWSVIRLLMRQAAMSRPHHAGDEVAVEPPEAARA